MSDDLSPQRLAAAREAVRAVARRTPMLGGPDVERALGAGVLLKAESLQRTGSFKLRGAAAFLAGMRPGAVRGVVAGSAGNHAIALAYAAAVAGVPCEVVVPHGAALSKIGPAREHGATVVEHGEVVELAIAEARRRADERGWRFVHPFDDPLVIAGQASLGSEILDEVDDLAMVIVPVGGGGLASGVAVALAQARPGVQVIGVQAAACAAVVRRLGGVASDAPAPSPTIADGIAIKEPSERTLELMGRHLSGMVTVDEHEIADAISLVLREHRLLVEGAGAVAVAAVLSGTVVPARDGATVAILSGGNVDPGPLLSVIRRHETRSGRRLVLLTRLPDRPSALAELLRLVGDVVANVIEVDHRRDGIGLDIQQSGVELVLETRGREHAADVLGRIAAAGYPLANVDPPPAG